MRKRKWERIGEMWVALDRAERTMTGEQKESYQGKRRQLQRLARKEARA